MRYQRHVGKRWHRRSGRDAVYLRVAASTARYPVEHMSTSCEPIISVSGLRGVIGESLTPLVAGRYAAAFAAEIPAGAVVITRDGRGTGAMLASAVAAALQAMGRKVIDAGIAATPTT